MEDLMRLLLAAAVLTSALTSSSAALAISSYQFEIPNGDAFSCRTCHESSGGGEGWNDFGQDILDAGGANPGANPADQNAGFSGSPADYWAQVCGNDSDGDGVTNGEELGDPDCVWAAGDPNPDGDLANPGDVESTPEAPGDPNGGGGDGGGDAGLGGCSSSAGLPGTGALLLVLARLSAHRRRGR
jgi:hypothetical protein